MFELGGDFRGLGLTIAQLLLHRRIAILRLGQLRAQGVEFVGGRCRGRRSLDDRRLRRGSFLRGRGRCPFAHGNGNRRTGGRRPDAGRLNRGQSFVRGQIGEVRGWTERGRCGRAFKTDERFLRFFEAEVHNHGLPVGVLRFDLSELGGNEAEFGCSVFGPPFALELLRSLEFLIGGEKLARGVAVLRADGGRKQKPCDKRQQQ